MQMNVIQQVGFLFRASLVQRYHNRTTLVTDTVGRHSFMVAWFIYIMYKGDPSAEILMAALRHDVAEVVMGDAPAPVTRLVEGLKERYDIAEAKVLQQLDMGAPCLTEVEANVLKLADRLEGYLFCTHEITGLGNNRVAGVRRKYYEYVIKAIDALPKEMQPRAKILFHACDAQFRAEQHDEEELCLARPRHPAPAPDGNSGSA